MFTGIVESTGTVQSTHEDEDGSRIRIGTTFDELARGQSISVSGACLTVEGYGDGWFEVFCSRETIDRTYLGSLSSGDVVNLERALPASGRFDGHIVQGHVDGTATITNIERIGDDWEYVVGVPPSLERYVVEKGSIAVDGISLTVASLDSETVSIAIIPETYDRTNLSEKSPGDPVHIEVDVVAKYVESITRAYET